MKEKTVDFGKDPIAKILFRLAPPVMLAQLIQALYNIVDSFFVGRNSESGLTALSIVYPLQLLMIALAVGTGVGINTLMAHFSGLGREEESQESAGLAMPLAVLSWIVFALLCFFFMPAYARISTKSADVIREVIVYGRIVCVCSIGLFLESGWTKVLQAEGDMRLPMVAQIAGAVVNIMLDPVLIFGLGLCPKWVLRERRLRPWQDRSQQLSLSCRRAIGKCLRFLRGKIISNVFIIWAFQIY